MLRMTITDDWVEIEAGGRLSREDYERFVPALERRLEEAGRLRCLIRLRDFGGWTPGALLEELRFDLRHREDFDRIAVVGERKLEEWGTKLSAPFFSGEVRYFDESEESEAIRWLKAKVASSSH